MSILAYNGGALIAMKGKNCVAIAADRRFGIQGQTISCDFQKIFEMGPHLYLGVPGLATDAQTVTEKLRFRLNLYELKENRKIHPKTFGSMISNLLYERRFGPFFVEPIVAGLDPETFEPFICNMDLIGCLNIPEDFVVGGTCTEQLYGMCEALYEPNLEPDDLFETISQALVNAYDRDAISGWGAIVHLIQKDKVITRSIKTHNISREKTSTRDDVNGTENQANSSSPSPSSSPGSHSHQSQINNNNNNVINKTQQQLRTTSSSSVRSPDSDADQNLSIQNLKAETDDPTSHRQDDNKCNIETNGTGARCISGIFGAHGKLKRLLGTLVQFAMDISPDTGDTVRTLVLGLLSGTMSAEEFHSALQEATNFPLRGFVLPYLKHTLPSLQRDLSAAARADNQTCAQYLRANESSVLEAVGLAPAGGDSVDPFAENAMPNHHYNMRPIGSSTSTTGLPTGLHSSATSHLGFAPGHAVKRRANDALYYENSTAFDEGPPYQKRSTNPWLQHHHQHQHHQQHIAHQQQHPSDVSYCWYTHPLHSSNSVHHAHGSSGSLIPSLVQIGNSQPGATNTSSYGTLQAHLSHQPAITTHGASSAASGAPMQNGSASLDDEWKNIHVMLNCILGMVEKTKRALAILQKRGCTSPAAATANPSNLQVPLANGGQVSNGTDNTVADGNFKRLSGDIVAQTIRATEDRVAEVKRRAEEAVLEVKRAAVAEVQRAVAAAVAESRANERLRSQRYIDSLPMTQQRGHTPQHGRPSPFLRLSESSTRAPTASSTTTNSTSTGACNDDVDKETHLPSGLNSNCWNCGRPALETCGGCGIARYCGSFCQHRDWEAGGHHANCANNSTSHHQQQQQQQQHHERARSSTPSPPRTGSTASGDSDATKSATLSTASVRSTK